MTDAEVRFGLVGYGFGGRYFHAPLIAGGAGVRAGRGGDGVAGAAGAGRAGAARASPVHDTVDDLVAAGVEAVAISTPADTHTALTEQALRLGLAVVCDKPFALDAAAARRHASSWPQRAGWR